jgi:protein ImuB
MLWACIHFFDLPLRAVFEDGELALPCAVVDGPPQRQLIVLANAPARHNGIGANHVLAAARALCGTLQARARDTAAEQRLLQSFAAWAYRFSSKVSLSEPDALLIEVGASLRLFGGWPALEHRLRDELAAMGYAPALAVAPVPMAARVLATRHDGFFAGQREPMLTALGNVPLAHSGLAENAIALLYNVGLRTLRDALALPRAELARRTGPAVLAMLDRLRGDAPEVLSLYCPPDRFAHRIEFDHHIGTWPPLLFPLRRLCGELALFLSARDGGVQHCELLLKHEGHAATRVPIQLLTPQREAHTLYELTRSRLERVALAAPVSALALIANDLPPLCPRHKDLFESKREQQLDWPELAERLRAHLGDETVRQLAIVADHRPERTCIFPPVLPAAEAVPQARVKLARDTRPRPVWLLPRALPLRGPPPRILAGPERIESGWWDGADARRDYYVVQTREGQRAWAYLAAGATDGWMLHGWFA